MSKYSMIKEAQTLAKVGKTSRYEALKEVQATMGMTLSQAAEFLSEDFSMKVTPDDYDEWIRQVIIQGENRKRAGTSINLNKRSEFNEMLGDVLENDPAGKVNLGDPQLSKHIFDAAWKRYQGTRDHLKATNVMKAREEEETLNRAMDCDAESMADYEGEEYEELNVNTPPEPEETDEFRPSSGANRYDDEDMSYKDDHGDDMEGEMDGDMEGGEGMDAGSDIPEECPYDEGTPECDAWMAGYEAAMGSQEEGTDDEDGMYNGLDREEGMDDMEGGDEGMDDTDPDMEGGMDDMEGEMDGGEMDRGPEENEEHGKDWIHTYWPNHGYKAAKSEYHRGHKSSPPKTPEARRQWERGYEAFMGDTEGQRDLKRRGAEDEEGSLLRSIISKPRDTLNQALKGVEDEGAAAFDKLQLPNNPHPKKSLAQGAWAKGFKNAVRGSFGFDVKPAEPRAKKRKK